MQQECDVLENSVQAQRVGLLTAPCAAGVPSLPKRGYPESEVHQKFYNFLDCA